MTAARERPWRNLYGRRQGKRLRPGQQRLLDTRLAGLALPDVAWEENPERRPVDLGAALPEARDVWVEIGFGGGEHMLAMAEAHPAVGVIGCEPFVSGVAKLLAAIERAGLGRNLRVVAGDARDLLDVLPDGSVGRVYLNYPDPWPKARHHKRRFVGDRNLAALVRVMRPGAELRLATDIPDYVRHSLEAVARQPRLAWTAERPRDWRQPWEGWPGSRYEAKALREGRTPHYLRFVRMTDGESK